MAVIATLRSRHRWAWSSVIVLLAIAFSSARIDAARADDPNKLKVLILGDSLALCGFGKRLDERFRNDPKVEATYTYMACGTNPLSWMKQKPYTSVKSACGFWSIEPADDSNAPAREMQDTYGTKRNQAPKPHLVPKLEDLMQTVQPDVLVIQTGSNLFGLFPDTKTVRPAQHGPLLKKYLLPFRDLAVSAPSTLRKIYYVNPPVSGRVAKEVQDFVYEQTRAQLTPAATVIDSRKLLSYPYKNMDPDKEHFLGEEMTQWADQVFEIVQRDISGQPIASLPLLSQAFGGGAVAQANPPQDTPMRAELANTPQVAARAEPVSPTEQAARAVAVEPTDVPPPAEPPSKPEPLIVKARLVFKSAPIPVKELLPYQESLVGYVYEIDKVVKGRYPERQVLVMHPAHIALKEQKLDKFKIGKRYKLRLDRMDGSLWDTAKARDESNQIQLLPYMRVDDKAKHPGYRTSR